MSNSAGTLMLNAWVGHEEGAVQGKVENMVAWALGQSIQVTPTYLVPRRADNNEWSDPEVGWGVVLAQNAPIPAPLQRLIQHRNNAPVFRFLDDRSFRYVVLRNEATGKDVDINASPPGTGPDALPYYLLICGSPKEIPWKLQYILNANRCVGRLDLDDHGLGNYVDALMHAWVPGTGKRAGEAVIWAVDHAAHPDAEPEITRLMRDAISDPLYARMRDDRDIGDDARFLDGSETPATCASLAAALKASKPAFVVTTSHGQTGPLDDPARMSRALGLPVDQAFKTLTPEELLRDGWQPDGLIWYAHACCGAGSDGESAFLDLFAPGTKAHEVLGGVANLGSQTAPLPRALLGAEKPARAFIGHVEPTFDWTLSQPFTGQFLTDPLLEALYRELYLAKPVGQCFRQWFARTGGLSMGFNAARSEFNRGAENDQVLLWYQLAARDIQSTVILGDPTVTLRPAGTG